ncbi:MAG: response regulator [Deltaproteobacteria bacterium]|nr:response regulator [Deltaproteobacteria bacterium]
MVATSSAQNHILIVEDDVDLREAICDVLTEAEYQVTGASDGHEALEALRAPGAPRPCVILLDLMMPVMSGYEFRDAQKADPDLADIPVVVMSARWSGKDEIDADEFIPKPIEVDRVLAALRRLCSC